MSVGPPLLRRACQHAHPLPDGNRHSTPDGDRPRPDPPADTRGTQCRGRTRTQGQPGSTPQHRRILAPPRAHTPPPRPSCAVRTLRPVTRRPGPSAATKPQPLAQLCTARPSAVSGQVPIVHLRRGASRFDPARAVHLPILVRTTLSSAPRPAPPPRAHACGPAALRTCPRPEGRCAGATARCPPACSPATMWGPGYALLYLLYKQCQHLSERCRWFSLSSRRRSGLPRPSWLRPPAWLQPPAHAHTPREQVTHTLPSGHRGGFCARKARCLA